MVISLVVITVFGGATLFLHDNFFIRLKPTVLYWVFSLSLLAARFVFKKNLIKAMLQKQITVPDNVWEKLNIAWVIFFTVMGCLNLYVAFNYPEPVWVNFKLFGTLGCMIVFVVIQSIILASYLKETPE
jgi:intracellular septation protein